MKIDNATIDKIIEENSLYQCLECGKCSSACPRLLAGKEYSPRLLAHKLIAQRRDENYIENSVWECLTCALCQERCPSGVDFSKFILEMRTLLAEAKGLKGYRSHDGAIHSWMRLMTSPSLKQNRLDWITPDMKVSQTGEVMFFVGCAPYFDVFFSGIEVDTLSGVRNSIKLLNFLDITPAVLENERCCGHDLLWTGDRENFEALCRLNFEEFKKAGVKEIIVSCPECYQVLSLHMPKVIPHFDVKVTFLMDMLEREIRKGGIYFNTLRKKVTFQDPCRLVRNTPFGDVPRALLKRVPELNLREMSNKGKGSICCGNNGFINCDAYSKQIQVKRLKEARESGAELLVTACPKCNIHLTCAMRDPLTKNSLKMELKDITTLLAQLIKWSEKEEPGIFSL